MDEQARRELRSEYPGVLGEAHIECPPGWEDLVRDICVYLRDMTDSKVEVVDIISQHGQIVINVNHGPVHVFRKIREVQEESKCVCETCGGPGAKHEFPHGTYTLCSRDCERRKEDD